MARRKFVHNTIALVYDFDGTLTPLPMQEYTILPKIGIDDGSKFWGEVSREARRANGEGIVTYMRLMLEKSQAAHFPVTRQVLAALARNIGYFPGVRGYFQRINDFVHSELPGVEVRHYVISAGLKEIIQGTSVAHFFHKIFACEYHYNEYGAAIFPNVIVNDTLKTQFIFRINKGKEALHENINRYTPVEDRPIPFQNILYIGDGLTDVPCMTVIRKNQGFAVAVFQSNNDEGLQTCKELLRVGRVDFIAEADYRKGSDLDKVLKLLLRLMAEGINYGRASFLQTEKYLR